MKSGIEAVEQEYIAALEKAEALRSARNSRQEELTTAERAFASACDDLARAEERLHKASEQFTSAHAIASAGDQV